MTASGSRRYLHRNNHRPPRGRRKPRTYPPREHPAHEPGWVRSRWKWWVAVACKSTTRASSASALIGLHGAQQVRLEIQQLLSRKILGAMGRHLFNPCHPMNSSGHPRSSPYTVIGAIGTYFALVGPTKSKPPMPPLRIETAWSNSRFSTCPWRR